MKEKTISKEKDHLNKEKEGNLHKEKENHEKEKNKTISHVKNNEPIKTGESKEKTKVKLENKTPMKTKNSPKPIKFREIILKTRFLTLEPVRMIFGGKSKVIKFMFF